MRRLLLPYATESQKNSPVDNLKKFNLKLYSHIDKKFA